MVTSIQISEDLKKVLQNRKLRSNETYEDVIWDLIEDALELNDETKAAIKQAELEYERGKTISHDELKRELEL